MRIVFTVLTGLSLITFITLAWYIFQPFCWSAITMSQTILEGFGLSSDELQLAVNNNALLYWANLLWGPLSDIFVILWMAVSAQRIDPSSEVF
jgi:hypothetical protein